MHESFADPTVYGVEGWYYNIMINIYFYFTSILPLFYTFVSPLFYLHFTFILHSLRFPVHKILT